MDHDTIAILERLDHLHRMLHSVVESQVEILDAITTIVDAQGDDEKLLALRDKITAKTAALKAALAAVPPAK